MSDQKSPRHLVVFTLGAEQYGLPIQQVHEIIRYTKPREVASQVEWVRGVISLRGRILPVFDLAARLGVHCEPGEQAKIVIVESESGSDTAGVIVDGVEEVLTVGPDQVEDVPGADTTLIDAVAKLGDRLVVLLKTAAISATAEAALA
jgi:purine-binding chemotaxis protein CheW